MYSAGFKKKDASVRHIKKTGRDRPIDPQVMAAAEAHFKEIVELLPVELQPKIVPRTAAEALPLVKHFITPELVGHIPKHHGLMKAFQIVVKNRPHLLHQANAAAQIAARQRAKDAGSRPQTQCPEPGGNSE